MGWISSVWSAVKTAGSAVTNVVKKVYEVCTSESAVAAYDKLDNLIRRQEIQTVQSSSSAPDFYRQSNTSHLEKKISQQSKQIVSQGAALKETQKTMALQVELARLRGSADLVDRSMKNVRIHASNLSLHYQNMRNFNGMLDYVNNLATNYNTQLELAAQNFNVLAESNPRIKKVESVVVERTDGSISQLAAYDVFDRTRDLLRNEVIDLSEIATKHLQDVEVLKSNAADLGGRLGAQIIDFVDTEIVPIIKRAESAGLLLKSEVSRIPAAIRDKSGMIVFENGGIKLETTN